MVEYTFWYYADNVTSSSTSSYTIDFNPILPQDVKVDKIIIQEQKEERFDIILKPIYPKVLVQPKRKHSGKWK